MLETQRLPLHSTLFYHRCRRPGQWKSQGPGQAKPSIPAALALALGLLAFCLLSLAVAEAGAGAGPAFFGPIATPPIGGSPARIVSLSPSVTEILFALGAGARVVGISDHCDFPAETKGLARVGTFLAPVVEAVLALRPDLVITAPSPANRGSVVAIQRAGVAVEVIPEGNLADLEAAIDKIAVAVGLDDQGRLLNASLTETFASVAEAARNRPRPRVAVIVGHQPLVMAGPRSYLGELVALAGGDNIAAVLDSAWPRVGWEFLLAASPEVVLDLSMGSENTSEEGLARRWARYQNLPAVGEGRVHGYGGGVFLRPGPRLADAARRLLPLFAQPRAGSSGQGLSQ